MVCLSVCLSFGVSVVSAAKTDEPIMMPFGFLAQVGSGNHVLDGDLDSPTGMGNNFDFERGKRRSIVK